VNCGRTDVAKSFIQILILKTKGIIEVEQKIPYGSIQLKKTKEFRMH
jgi:chromatin segregation and condensation protein Rec8/ScpA/Scc1 (kleisin family)